MAITLNGTTGITTPKLDALDLELGSVNVVERGSNANGEYVRFADGTQMCWLREMILAHTSNVDLVTSWVFPATFLVGKEPKTDVSVRAAFTTNNYTVAKLASSSGTASTALRTQFSVTQDYSLGLFAIGRWF